MTEPATAAVRRPWLLAALIGLLLVSAATAVFLVWKRPGPDPKPEPDLMGALAANTRGVGLMERYEYAEAEKAFAEAVRLAPDWLPAQVNRGIAVMNQNTPETKARAIEQFRQVLDRDPDNMHAHYCSGIIRYDDGKFAEAHAHFAAVNRLDPEDAYTWLRLGTCHPAGKESPEARACFERALKLNPYLNEARFRLASALRADDPEKSRPVHDQWEELKAADWIAQSGIKYSEMGPYGDVIGRDPALAGKPPVGPVPMFEHPAGFQVVLAPRTRWAPAADLDPLRQAARRRFGGTVILFDYNRDGRPDVLLLAAVVENGQLRDLLLRNDGGWKFTDVTAAAGLAAPRTSLGAAAADYDNDGLPDLVITGAGGQHLFRNQGDGTFADLSAAAGLDRVTGVCLGCGWIDLDQDGDLDLILCRYAGSPEAAAGFSGQPPTDGGLLVFENVGVAPPVPPAGPVPALTTKFQPDDRLPTAAGRGAPIAFVAADLDSDQDIDLVILNDRAEPIVIENDRLMRFRRATPAWAAGHAHAWNGGLVLDANHDERSDLVRVRADGAPIILLSKGRRDFVPGHTNSPTLRQAVAIDLDMDGWPDMVGLGHDGKPVLLQNQGDGRFEYRPGAFGEAPAALELSIADLDGDGTPDVVTWTESGLTPWRSLGNGNRAVLVEPTGLRRPRPGEPLPGPERTNADGIGCWLSAQAGATWTGAERTTLSAGLGQSLLPTALGLGNASQADVVRIRWPDGVLQAELLAPVGPVFRVAEFDRKPTSCPVLLTWDGERYVYVTDFLGAGAMGELGPDGTARPPRPEESVKIEPGQLRPKHGRYLLRIAEPMDEVLYLDHFQLEVIDHPAGTTVYPDERFATADPPPTQRILAYRTPIQPRAAIDHRGTDYTPAVRDRDRRAVNGFHLRSWLGYAEDHSLTLDFGTIPDGDGKNWFLVLAGWTEYPFAESIYAATRAGVPLRFPVLERRGSDGKTWEPLGDLGFPAGLPRVMTSPLPDLKPGPCVLRIRTNMQVYWDQVSLVRIEDVGMRTHTLDVERADLAAHRGMLQEILPDGRPPIAYDPARTEPVPVTRWEGRLTRTGDVTELLTARDDRFVILGPGDEVKIRFDGSALPNLPDGWQRSFVLRSRGYSKDTTPFTATGGQVGPLPFRGMKNYPDFGGVEPPGTDAARWHTRPANGGLPASR